MLFSGSFYQTPVSNSDASGVHCGSVRTVLYGLARGGLRSQMDSVNTNIPHQRWI